MRRRGYGGGAGGDITVPLPVNEGGTNSTTPLNNNRVMKSAGGAVVEMGAFSDSANLIGADSLGSIPTVVTLTAANGASLTRAGNTLTINGPGDAADTTTISGLGADTAAFAATDVFAVDRGSDSVTVKKSFSTLRLSLDRSLDATATPVGNSGGTETTLSSTVISGGVLGTNKDCLELSYMLAISAAATAAETIKVHLFGTSITLVNGLSFTSAGAVTVYVTAMRKDVATVEYGISIQTTGVSLTSDAFCGEVASLDLTSDVTVKITGQSTGTGSGSSDITLRLAKVRKEAAP